MSSLQLFDPLSVDPFEDMFRGFFKPVRWELPTTAPQIRLDLTEDPSAFTVKAEIPGVRKEDIDVRIEGNQVTLSAEVKKEKETKDNGRVVRSERYHGMVNRSFQLSSRVDESKASAKYENGILELVLPKRESAESKRLTIK